MSNRGLIELRFYVPLHRKQVISETFPKPISWFGTEKLNLTQQKHTFTNQKKCTTTTKTTTLWPFVWDYPGEPVPEETLTHPPSFVRSFFAGRSSAYSRTQRVDRQQAQCACPRERGWELVGVCSVCDVQERRVK